MFFCKKKKQTLLPESRALNLPWLPHTRGTKHFDDLFSPVAAMHHRTLEAMHSGTHHMLLALQGRMSSPAVQARTPLEGAIEALLALPVLHARKAFVPAVQDRQQRLAPFVQARQAANLCGLEGVGGRFFAKCSSLSREPSTEDLTSQI
jgi:hypothetical protein